ncbi:uncharacterized protein LOC135346170 isoform X2 [Halichondria panicea]|uniref:uncharacterized protein LOC135346170 isoform X2 n=1 Tax=Halichondria panicea TaxID=6063 RepID=UPI00312BB15A
MTAATSVLFLCSVLPILSLAQLQGQCDLPGYYQPEGSGFYVYPNLSCTDNGLTIQLVHNYAEDLSDSRIQLFYECTAASGEVSSNTVPDSYNTRIDDFVYSVPLSSLLVDPGSTCAVYGCYEESSIDEMFEHFPIQSRTCQYTTGSPPSPSSPPPVGEVTYTEVPTQETSATVQVSTQEVTTEGRVESQCTLIGDYQPEGSGFYVYPDLSCTDNGLTIQLVHNYTEDLSDSRIQLFYECTAASGEISNDIILQSHNSQLDDHVYSVSLSSLLVDPGYTCAVYGCYEENTTDKKFPIQNRTCQYTTDSPPSPSSPPPVGEVTTPNGAGIIGSCRSLFVILAGIVLAIGTL